MWYRRLWPPRRGRIPTWGVSLMVDPHCWWLGVWTGEREDGEAYDLLIGVLPCVVVKVWWWL